jgi:hypothetical protein
MISETIERTSLWSRTLAPSTDDLHAKHRERLRVGIDVMRENAMTLARQIHRDVLGLTVHDETHLDALWQTADAIAGDDFDLTPVEAFVFGAAVLLHDTAMAVAAYPGGMTELENTVEWADAAAAVRANRASEGGEFALSKEESQRVLFTVLRLLHARQAEKLIQVTFSRPGRAEEIPLLQDAGLKDAFAASIGRIAHSHHWNVGDLLDHLETKSGSAPGFPPEWTLNEVKVACLLRCADAAHIDSRRAPTLLYAISKPGGISGHHWQFQNKLNQVTRAGDKLVFSSGQTFRVEESASWWLAYDTLKMIDAELKGSNAILLDSSNSEFAAKSVAGIESPKLIARHLRLEGWSPVDAEVRVSDPVHLARTLGGRNLYGAGPFPPIRELLQNGVDAVRARRLQEDREPTWGKVRLIIEPPQADNTDYWLHVDDTGVGMSERVLTGPLIDFGKSLWSSGLMQEEFPGLQARNLHPIGKFGIGFFAVFLLGENVKVISRRYDAGTDATRVLAFDDLNRRPLIRPAFEGELPRDFQTRVSVKLRHEMAMRLLDRTGMENRRNGRMADRLTQLVCAVDVEVEYANKVDDEYRSHKSDWRNLSPAEFLNEALATTPKKLRDNVIRVHETMLSVLEGDGGEIYGRAALSLIDERSSAEGSLVSVGGFALPSPAFSSFFSDELSASINSSRLPLEGKMNFVGVINGETDDAARRRAKGAVPPQVIAQWASAQARVVDKARLRPEQLVRMCHEVQALGGDPHDLPFGFLAGSFLPFRDFESAMQESGALYLLATFEEYKTRYSLLDIDSLRTPLFTIPLAKNVGAVRALSASAIPESAFSEDRRGALRKSSGGELLPVEVEAIWSIGALGLLFSTAKRLWGSGVTGRLGYHQIFSADLLDPPLPRLCFSLHQPN